MRKLEVFLYNRLNKILTLREHISMKSVARFLQNLKNAKIIIELIFNTLVRIILDYSLDYWM